MQIGRIIFELGKQFDKNTDFVTPLGRISKNSNVVILLLQMTLVCTLIFRLGAIMIVQSSVPAVAPVDAPTSSTTIQCRVQCYTRSELLSFRRPKYKRYLSQLASLGILHYRGSRGGEARRRQLAYTSAENLPGWNPENSVIYNIEVVSVGRRINKAQCTRPRVLSKVPRITNTDHKHTPVNSLRPPSLYVLNPTSIAKPHAVQHLQADVEANQAEIVVLSETWLKSHHPDASVSLPGYNLFRRDRKRRKGGGTAIYIKQSYDAFVLDTSTLYSDNIELLWISFVSLDRNVYVGAIYNPPKPIYTSEELSRALESSLELILSRPGDPLVILAGDFNQMSNQTMLYLGLVAEFNDPTHAGHCLDRIYASEHVYIHCRSIESLVSTKKSLFVY